MRAATLQALRRPLLLTCIALALPGVASTASARPYVGIGRPGERQDPLTASEVVANPTATRVGPPHVNAVSNCADSGTGSLRAAVAAAVSGDTIDLTQLACSNISLTTGSIQIPQNTLSLVGPGRSLYLGEQVPNLGRVLTHTGTGTLSISDMTVIGGYESESGGCIRSAGNLTLDNVYIVSCQSGTGATTSAVGGGGAAFVAGNLTMSRSMMKFNLAFAGVNGRAFGGGAYVRGNVDIRESTISANYIGVGNRFGNVGGITIGGTGASTIVNSTIADNFATNNIGGLYAYTQLTLSNSTVSFNAATNGVTATGAYLYYGPLVINSTILSNNTWGNNNESDLLAYGSVTGANNLIMASNIYPPGTLTSDPQLQTPSNNGGPTETRAILATSPAFNAGNNVAGLTTDQRGAGFARQSGTQVDIGAFEFQVPPPPTYTIGGTVAGVAGSGLILQQNGGDNRPIAASGGFTFATPLTDGTHFNVTVLAQPTSPNQTCAVANGAGVVAGANVTNVAVTCTTLHYTVGGTVTGLTGNGLILQQNGGDNLPIAANGSFTFTTPVTDGAQFDVTVLGQPASPNQTCVVSNGAGTIAGANVANVTVTCTTRQYTVGGNVNGLAGSGLVLQQNGADNLPIAGNGSFAFPTLLTDGSPFDVTVLTQPASPNQTCAVTNGEGVVAGANVANVAVACMTTHYTVGGTVSGLAGSGLVLQQAGGDSLPIATNGSFTFPTSLPDGSPFTVTVSAQPGNPPQTCVIANGNGTLAGSDVTDVAVTCSTDTSDLIFANGFEVD